MSELLREEMYAAANSLRKNASKSSATPELLALRPILERQQKESIIPKSDQFLIETFKTREGYHSVFYPFEGRLYTKHWEVCWGIA